MGIVIKSGILHTLKLHLHTLSCHFWLNLRSKTYSSIMSILNNRIVKYCSSMGIFPEEQNGLWKHRSCQDHIYIPSQLFSKIISLKTNDNTVHSLIWRKLSIGSTESFFCTNCWIITLMVKCFYKNTSHKYHIMYWTKWVTTFRMVWKCLWCSTGWLFIINTVQLVYQWFGYTLIRVWTNTRPQWWAHIIYYMQMTLW